jgi:hypothetical protein
MQRHRYCLRRLLALLIALSASVPVVAHVQPIPGHVHGPGVTYSSIGLYERGVVVLFTVPYQDAFSLRPGLVNPAPKDLVDIVSTGIIVRQDSPSCALERVDAADYGAIQAFQYKLHFACESLDFLTFDYQLFSGQAHINYVDVWLGPHNMALILDEEYRSFEMPVAYLLWERGWQLPDRAPALTGEMPPLSQYLVLGFDHVMTGLDHLFFVLGLVLLVHRFLPLIGLITSFTIAHSITLGTAALNIYVLPEGITELLIGVSIVYIGLENLWGLRHGAGTPGSDLGQAALRRRWFSSFAFGLVHGFGFSFLLREVGLPPDQLLPSLALFNIGVELAQIAAVIVPFIILQRLLRGTQAFTIVAAVLAVAVTCSGLWWVYDRWD